MRLFISVGQIVLKSCLRWLGLNTKHVYDRILKKIGIKDHVIGV